MDQIIECVPNFSEGRDLAVIRQITQAIERVDGAALLDVDPGHATNRTVVTFAGAPEAVVEAAIAVGAHEFIEALPKGYDTMLAERGSNLSLGQRQLLSFARALVADAKILVLDEATANIDSYTEMQIQKALQRLLEGRTGLVIAHRLATIRNADRIIVLQQGRLVEQGDHDTLIEYGGLYAQLYQFNYASFDDLPDEMSDDDRALAT